VGAVAAGQRILADLPAGDGRDPLLLDAPVAVSGPARFALWY
jgi:hypothetical protein